MNTGEKPKNTKKLNDSTKKNILLFFLSATDATAKSYV